MFTRASVQQKFRIQSNFLKKNIKNTCLHRLHSDYGNAKICLHVIQNYQQVQKTTMDEKWIFLLRISSVNVTKSTVSCGFGRIYWKNPQGNLQFLCGVSCFFYFCWNVFTASSFCGIWLSKHFDIFLVHFINFIATFL